MKALKSVISITLLFAYLLGFSHSLTPHCEIDCDGQADSKHEHHHQHDHAIGDTDLEHDHHVAHGDHYDEGWMDYMACLFSDAEHHENGCHTEHLIDQENIQFKNSKGQDTEKNSTSAFALFVDYELIGEKLATTSNRVNGPPIHSERQTRLISFSLRGPPFYSC